MLTTKNQMRPFFVVEWRTAVTYKTMYHIYSQREEKPMGGGQIVPTEYPLLV